MKPTILNQSHSVVNTFIAELRNTTIQKDPLRFRINLQRLGWCIAYELSKEMQYSKQDVTTPLGVATEFVIDETVVLGTVLRAGLPFHQGFLDVFDRAENAFVGAARVEVDGERPEVSLGYEASPNLEGKVLVMIDPMIATGKSLIEATKALVKSRGQPKAIVFCGAIGSQAGVDYVQAQMPDSRLYIAAVDAELDENYYIVPGLGDAGDLSFGEKM